MTDQQRRRVDLVLDPSYVDALEDVAPEDLRAKLRDAKTEEDSISYVRRSLHGHLDLLRAELELRRGGRGTTRSVEALTGALASAGSSAGGSGTTGRGGRAGLGLRAATVAGRRGVERVLLEDHLARLPDMSDEEIGEITDRVAEAERRLSADRQRLFDVIEALETELAGRYKNGLATSLERLL